MELTSRQKQVLQMLVDGHSPKEIANVLAINRRTVEKHLYLVRRKYGVSTRDEMIAQAVAYGDVYVFLGEVRIKLPAKPRARQMQS